MSKYAVLKQEFVTRIHRGVHQDLRRLEPLPTPLWADEFWINLHTQARGLQLVRSDAVISGASAAALYGWPTSTKDLTHLHVKTPHGRPLRRSGVIAKRSEFLDSNNIAGVNVLRCDHLLLELAAEESELALVQILDCVLGTWHGPPQATPDDIAVLVNDSQGRIGHPALRAAAKRARTGVDSPQESRLRLAIVDAGLPEPVVHYPITLATGLTIHPDLAFPAARIAIEYEGEHHLLDSRQWNTDIARERDLRELGWIVIRVTKHTAISELIDAVRQALIAAEFRM